MSKMKRYSGGIFCFYFLSLFFVGCGNLDMRVDGSDESISEPLKPTETPVPTPTIVVNPTLSPEQQMIIDQFDSESLGGQTRYDLEFFLLDDGELIAKSAFDEDGDPHFSFDYESKEWVNNHPGRNGMDYLLPKSIEGGRSIWLEFNGNKWDAENERYISGYALENVAVWDQEHMAYRYLYTMLDPGHDQFFLPMMGPTRRFDFDHGRANFCETIQSDDYEIGVSGVRLDFYISDRHAYVQWWENLPKQEAGQILADMYLQNFSELKGKLVFVRVINEDITEWGDFSFTNRETFYFDEDKQNMQSWRVGLIPDIVPDTHMITLSLDESNYKDDETYNDYAFPYVVHKAAIWALLRYPDSSDRRQSMTKLYEIYNPISHELSDLAKASGQERYGWKLKE